MYLLRSSVGQKFTSWTAFVGAADPINTPETLDDPDGIPMDVVVDEIVAVLKVLTFGNAISGNELDRFRPPAA